MILTLLTIVAAGVFQTRRKQSIDQYLRSGNEMGWLTIGLGVMATQASAITFLSAPGLGYESGLRFVQFYFGMPIAIVLISKFFIPIYYKLKVYTAYEYLEQRFDLRVRLFTAFLFLVQRGLAAGLTIYAPAIILSTILGWNLNLTIIGVGGLVIIYTVSGGSKAVSITQKWQMSVILGGMFVAGAILLGYLFQDVGINEALSLAGRGGRMQAIDTGFDFNERYTLWSGLTGGLFLALSYFGTDQSQVQRYLGGKSVKESRLGLLFNALIKVPMQFSILLIGVLIYVFYHFERPPIHFNEEGLSAVRNSDKVDEIFALESAFVENHKDIRMNAELYVESMRRGDPLAKERAAEDLARAELNEHRLRTEARTLIAEVRPDQDVKDTNYVFLHFVLNYLPHGLIGLLLAVILSAAMSSTSGELSALSSTTLVDFYKRLSGSENHETAVLSVGKWMTVGWGLLAIGFAWAARLFDNLIEMVNLLGSLFYGTILGVFLVAFFFKRIKSTAVFWAALLAEAAVLIIHFGRVQNWKLFETFHVEYLWYNVIGCVLLVALAFVFEQFNKPKKVSA
jgi:SSS family transporter